MTKQCDHKTVGMIVRKDGKILLIKRKKPPFGFAPPAGHVDEDNSFEQAAKRELKEEVGLGTENIKLIVGGRKENRCRRPKGIWHYWKIYDIDAKGEIIPSKDEVKQFKWCSKDDLSSLAQKTEQYLKDKIKKSDWEKSPGLEPVWYSWFKELKII
jgi:ADP-ribose pyrophosphatase YjhB (NUDIX family)